MSHETEKFDKAEKNYVEKAEKLDKHRNIENIRETQKAKEDMLNAIDMGGPRTDPTPKEKK